MQSECSATVVRRLLSLVFVLQILVSLSLEPIQTKASAQDAQEIEPQAAPGALDPSFGTGGKVTTDFFGNYDLARDVLLQPDGKILVAGSANTGERFVFSLARYNTDGSLDAGFGTGGKVTTDFFNQSQFFTAIALQQDGKILAAGGAELGGIGRVAVVRYSSNGNLDLAFGTAGKVIIDFGTSIPEGAPAIAMKSDGKIVLALTVFTRGVSFSRRVALARLNAGGTIDASFGSGGTVVGPLASFLVEDMLVQPDGNLVVAGWGAGPPLPADFALTRYNSNGILDTTFGNSGITLTDFVSFSDFGVELLSLPDGKLLIAGIAEQDRMRNSGFALARYSSDGRLDTSFGIGGKILTNFPAGSARAHSAAVQPDGRIVLAGDCFASFTSQSLFALARYSTDGSLDSSFGFNGLVVTDFRLHGRAFAMALQPDDKIVLAGLSRTTSEDSSSDFAVARYLGSSAEFSLSFVQPIITGQRPSKVRVEILVNRLPGFTRTVTVTPPDPTPDFKPKPAEPKSTTEGLVVFKLKIRAGATPGPQQVTFTGRSEDGQISNTTMTLIIQ